MRAIDGDHLKSILQEYVKREEAYAESGNFFDNLISTCVAAGLLEAIHSIEEEPPAKQEIAKEYDLKKIYNIYVKIAQAHFVYQPSKPKTITAMPFDWIEVQNLLEKYLEDHGADFDALRREYVSENVKDDHLPHTEPDWIPCSKRLPKKSGKYYVSGEGKAWICEYLIIPNFIGGWCNDASKPVVQAWMPLPTPWKGE